MDTSVEIPFLGLFKGVSNNIRDVSFDLFQNIYSLIINQCGLASTREDFKAFMRWQVEKESFTQTLCTSYVCTVKYNSYTY